MPRFAYLAAPLGLHGTKRYAECLVYVARYFADAVVIAGVFHSTQAWLALWSELRPLISIGVVLPERDRSVGRGVYLEITALQDDGKKCYRVNEANCLELLEPDSFELLNEGTSLIRYARI